MTTNLDLSQLNDLRRRIANDGEYSRDEVVHAIRAIVEKRADFIAEVTTPKKKAPRAKPSSGALDDLLG